MAVPPIGDVRDPKAGPGLSSLKFTSLLLSIAEVVSASPVFSGLLRRTRPNEERSTWGLQISGPELYGIRIQDLGRGVGDHDIHMKVSNEQARRIHNQFHLSFKFLDTHHDATFWGLLGCALSIAIELDFINPGTQRSVERDAKAARRAETSSTHWTDQREEARKGLPPSKSTEICLLTGTRTSMLKRNTAMAT